MKRTLFVLLACLFLLGGCGDDNATPDVPYVIVPKSISPETKSIVIERVYPYMNSKYTDESAMEWVNGLSTDSFGGRKVLKIIGSQIVYPYLDGKRIVVTLELEPAK